MVQAQFITMSSSYTSLTYYAFACFRAVQTVNQTFCLNSLSLRPCLSLADGIWSPSSLSPSPRLLILPTDRYPVTIEYARLYLTPARRLWAFTGERSVAGCVSWWRQRSRMSILQIVTLVLEAILGLFTAYAAYSLFTSTPPSVAKMREALHFPRW